MSLTTVSSGSSGSFTTKTFIILNCKRNNSTTITVDLDDVKFVVLDCNNNKFIQTPN